MQQPNVTILDASRGTGGWSKRDLNEICRVQCLLARIFGPTELIIDRTDQDEPWATLVGEDGDVVAHFAREGFRFVADMGNYAVLAEGQTLREAVSRALVTSKIAPSVMEAREPGKVVRMFGAAGSLVFVLLPVILSAVENWIRRANPFRSSSEDRARQLESAVLTAVTLAVLGEASFSSAVAETVEPNEPDWFASGRDSDTEPFAIADGTEYETTVIESARAEGQNPVNNAASVDLCSPASADLHVPAVRTSVHLVENIIPDNPVAINLADRAGHQALLDAEQEVAFEQSSDYDDDSVGNSADNSAGSEGGKADREAGRSEKGSAPGDRHSAHTERFALDEGDRFEFRALSEFSDDRIGHPASRGDFGDRFFAGRDSEHDFSQSHNASENHWKFAAFLFEVDFTDPARSNFWWPDDRETFPFARKANVKEAEVRPFKNPETAQSDVFESAFEYPTGVLGEDTHSALRQEDDSQRHRDPADFNAASDFVLPPDYDLLL